MRILRSFQKFVRTLGPVEQAQVVASTAIVVAMITIISARAATGQTPGLMEFISVLTVGLFGLVTVSFSLRYGRQMAAQERHLLALNALAAALGHLTDPPVVLETALKKLMGFFETPFGWVYTLVDSRPVLSYSAGTSADFFTAAAIGQASLLSWVSSPHVCRERTRSTAGTISPDLKALGIQFWAVIPFSVENSTTGFFAVAGPNYLPAQPTNPDLMKAFGNAISVSMTNAWLFDQLKSSRRQYADLFENAPDIYLSVGSDRTILDCNATGARVLGAPKAQIVGRKVEEWFTADRRDAVKDLFNRTLAQGDALHDEEEIMVDASGRQISVLLNSSLDLDNEGRPVTARIVARDISQRKKMEAAILHAQKLDSIGNLAGGIAHDFNNLLTAVLGSANILRRQGGDSPERMKYIEIIESSAHRGSTLTRQLLTFARKTERRIKLIDVNALVTDTLPLFERGTDKRITIETHLSPDLLATNGDEGQIQQALLNLLTNAREAMPDGGTLRVETESLFADSRHTTLRPGPFVVIRVSDTGRGMPRDVQSRVFEPFYSTKDQGTGLGLSVVYGVVQSHGGFINLESMPGKGTSVTLHLPRLSVKTPAQRQHLETPRGTEQILIIDDEDSVAEIARVMLAGLGYTVHVEHNGRTGVEFYRGHGESLALVLLDVNMPVMGGKEAFKQIRGINPAARIIILTGYGRETIEAADFGSRVNAFMQKPFHLETLAMTVRQVLDDSSVANASDQPAA